MNGIKRNLKNTGWIIPDKYRARRRSFMDKNFGDSEGAYHAAKQELIDNQSCGRAEETHVRPNKKSLDIVGITYYKVKDGNQVKHRFAVCNPVTGKPKMVHIGNDNTYLKNWDAKLAEAEQLREQFKQEHHDRQA